MAARAARNLLALLASTAAAQDWDAALNAEAFQRVRFPNGTGLPMAYCSHCRKPIDGCDAAGQTHALIRYLAELRKFLSDGNAKCAGLTQRSCRRRGDWSRKGCMRRTRGGRAAIRLRRSRRGLQEDDASNEKASRTDLRLFE